MSAAFFWNTWIKSHKIGFLFLFILFLTGLCLLLLTHFSGQPTFIDWNTLAEMETAPVVIDEFVTGPFSLTQTAESTIFFKEFVGSPPLISSIHYLLFGAMIFVMVLVLMMVVSTLKKFWFYVGCALFAFFLVGLKLELLLLFDHSEKVGLVVALVAYFSILYYLNAFRDDLSLFLRFLVLAGITIGLCFFLHYAATINQPLFYITTSMITPAIVLCIIFILSVSHEIVAGFAYILFGGKGTTTTKAGTVHFLIISIIYLINLVLAYMHEAGLLHWDILYINAFFLLTVSSILGIWGVRHREPQYASILRFQPYGGFVYLALGIIAFVTIAHLHMVGNDAGLETIRDFIWYGHICYGFIFLLYVLVNFAGLLKSGLPIYKVIYKPTSMPYFTFRFAGTIVVIALVLRANYQVPLFQISASNHNAVADYHYVQGERVLASRYYSEAAEYALYNHKSNYSLGVINESTGNSERAIVRYKEAIKKWPGPQAYLNLIHLYEEENRFFDALFTAREADRVFPNSYQILNKNGLLYGGTTLLDSAIFYTGEGIKTVGTSSLTSNMIALFAKNNLSIPLDSIGLEYPLGTDLITVNNMLALGNKLRQEVDYKFTMSDSTLSNIDLAVLNNAYLNQLLAKDTADTKVLAALASHAGNWAVKEPINYLECLHLYKNGQVNRAFRSLNWMANTYDRSSGKYFDDIGLWALKEEAYDVATNYFRWALDRGFDDARLHLAIAESENQNKSAALDLWHQLVIADQAGIKPMAVQMIDILSANLKEAASWKDSDKYIFSRYQLGAKDTTHFKGLLQSMSEPNYKAQATLDMCKKLWRQGHANQSIALYHSLADISITDEKLFEEIQFFELNILAHLGEIRGLAQKLNQDVQFNGRHLEKAYFTALINEASNDTIAAKNNYEYVSQRNPFYPESVIAAANFFHRSDPFKAYEILLSALEVNPDNIMLLEAYIYQCGRIQQNTSAEIALETLFYLVNSKKYVAVKKKYSALNEAAATAW